MLQVQRLVGRRSFADPGEFSRSLRPAIHGKLYGSVSKCSLLSHTEWVKSSLKEAAFIKGIKSFLRDRGVRVKKKDLSEFFLFISSTL